MTITRQKIIGIREGSIGTTSAAFDKICHLAIRALDTEADARLGKAVREAISGMDPEGQIERIEKIARHHGDDFWEGPVFAAIAAALRAEVKP